MSSRNPLAQQQFVVNAADYRIVARSSAEVAEAEVATRLILAQPPSDAVTRRIEARAAPLRSGSPVGRRYLGAAPARALALGEPPQSCPAQGVAERAASPEAAAALALRECLGALADREDCGCRLIAVNATLLASPAAFAYAPGVSGRLLGAGGARAPLAVEERATDDPTRTIVGFFDAAGPVAVGEIEEGGAARLMVLATGAIFEGAREKRGWRRGRTMERLLLTGADGARLIALIGFEPADIAAEGATLGDWPSG